MAVLLALGVLFGAIACDSSTSGGVAPTTGILIRAETLTTEERKELRSLMDELDRKSTAKNPR